ncbi:hypothetical protein BDM02DRAFT_3121426 [Thelephora ganbajun]|uniref:Uncharacterized protein n=1 Tax=Thelephora ganbajun TaxID=370292 RepID=A0ACB6Z5A8_THEGA|nr:hypothetical protein BDM02DRAFT_3121426 [Thelephora ganbajun]
MTRHESLQACPFVCCVLFPPTQDHSFEYIECCSGTTSLTPWEPADFWTSTNGITGSDPHERWVYPG